MALDAPAMVAAMGAAVGTLLTTQPAALPPTVSPAAQAAQAAPAAVKQTPVLEAAQPAARSLAAPPSTITIIAWKTITGHTFLHLLNLMR